MYGLLWLLLPVAAASGWFAATQVRDKRHASGAHDISRDYFKGLNYLINEQPDKAVDVFVKVLEVDSDTVDIHIAVGSLFRRRGEVDRAIRVHQNLLDKGHLEPEQRILALRELGRDFMKAGLLDRAEGLLQDLLVIEPDNEPALKLLKTIYQREKEWNKAAEVVDRLQRATGVTLSHELAQYYCELALEARAERDLDRAFQLLSQALSSDPSCVRASIIEGQLHADNGECEAAIDCFKRVEQQDADFVVEVLDAMLECYYRLDQPHAMNDYVQNLLRQSSSVKTVAIAADLLRREHGDHDAAIYIAHSLNKFPSLDGLQKLVELNMASSTGELRDTFRVIKATLDRLLENKSRYRCQRCGFGGKVMHWLCPSCQNWNTLKPVKAVLNEPSLYL
jgi:lipopolysaccharide biosynthesis regulator YciM